MKTKKIAKPSLLPRVHIGRRNILLFSLGVLVTIAGFVLMSFGPWDNPLSRTYAPIVLLVAYMIIFPWAIMADSKKNETEQDKAVVSEERVAAGKQARKY